MTHFMNLCANPFLLIKSGEKRVEMRLYDDKRRKIKSGDQIEFTNLENNEKLLVAVLNVKVFNNFATLYKNYDKTVLGYLENEIADPKDMMQYYPEEEMQNQGVCAIEIKLI